MSKGLKKRMDRSNGHRPELRRHIRALLDEENGYFIRRQQEHADVMNQRRQRVEANQKVKEAQQKLKEIAQKKREHDKLLAACCEARCFSLESLGNGRPLGGIQANIKNRIEVMNKLRTCAHLTFPQSTSWTTFCQMWDKKMREEKGTTWGKDFAEMMKQIMTSLQQGDCMALSRFMESERLRILADEQCLQVPAICFG